jgi:branched-subunit amino acid permease
MANVVFWVFAILGGAALLAGIFPDALPIQREDAAFTRILGLILIGIGFTLRTIVAQQERGSPPNSD